MDRRSFLKSVGVAGGTALASRAAGAAGTGSRPDGYAMLIDLTRCEGCRTCEALCAQANGLDDPDWSDDYSYADFRPTTPDQWTSVNRVETSKGELFVKGGCMHCVEPACAAACLTKALVKTPEGPVVWRADKCMGCRYCMVSCPFDAPRYEYDSPNPRLGKCVMCWERLVEGAEQPVCAANCPGEAITFGKRSEVLEVAKRRIYTDPDRYHSHIYGEHEAGGTGVMYLSPVPFEELGFRTDLDTQSYPELTRDFLTAVPVVLLLWPVFQLGLRRSRLEAENGSGDHDGPWTGGEV